MSTHYLHLGRLDCRHAASFLGRDRCRLSLRIDGAHDELFHVMNSGECWDINQSFPFEEGALITLWGLRGAEPPALGAHHKLGELEVHATAEEEQEHEFRDHGALYRLRYRVSARTEPDPMDCC